VELKNDIFVPTKCIAHRDFDGLIAGVLLEKCFEIPAIYVGYNKLEQTVNTWCDEKSKVAICDISLPENLYTKQFVDDKIILIDHHETTLPLVGKKGVYFDQKYAGSTLTYKWLLLNHPWCKDIIKPYLDLTICSQDYDLWIHNDWRSVYWTALIHELGFNNVRQRFLTNSSVDFTLDELRVVKRLSDMRNHTRKIIEQESTIVKAKDDSHSLLIFSEPEQKLVCMFEELSHFAKQQNYDMTLIIYHNSNRCSLRSTEMNILETKWNTLFRGHPQACGMKVEKKMSNVLDLLEEMYIIS